MTLAGNGETPIALDFLAAPQQPNEIGRLGPYRVLGVRGPAGWVLGSGPETPNCGE